jgi:hypothetical protein
MKKKTRKIVQVVSGRWYAIASGGEPFEEECCDCGLVHRVEYRVKNGRIWQRWVVDAKATAKARKAVQKYVKNPTLARWKRGGTGVLNSKSSK